jgi:hypothetical protein
VGQYLFVNHGALGLGLSIIHLILVLASTSVLALTGRSGTKSGTARLFLCCATLIGIKFLK